MAPFLYHINASFLLKVKLRIDSYIILAPKSCSHDDGIIAVAIQETSYQRQLRLDFERSHSLAKEDCRKLFLVKGSGRKQFWASLAS